MASYFRSSFINDLATRLRTAVLENRRADREREAEILRREVNGAGTDSTDDAGRRPPGAGNGIGKTPLKISGVTFYPQENGKNHRTSKFELVERGTPILRRGQNFFIALMYASEQSRKFDPNVDQLKLIFSFGPHPSPINGTEQILKVGKVLHSDESRWSARVKGVDKNAMTLEVHTGADSCVGIWKCRVETSVQKMEGIAEKFLCPDDIYLLFNPWDSDDVTYMKEKELLNEYVLEDKGKIWMTSSRAGERTKGRPWAYGQFDDSVLPLTMILLEKSGVPFASRGNPILVSRVLSKMVNSNDDNGVLWGKWAREGEKDAYADGTAPYVWTGSIPIIEQYFQTNSPVRYGQCWVFAGVLCTLCRAIGIPCRVVSNFISAHDKNGTLTIDKYYDEKNNDIGYDPNNLEEGAMDSIWTFHVWNDVFFARPDLPKGYGGWQAIDATPQETSDGYYQCGPASLEAVRKGQVGYAYDVPFVLAEVNADVVHWRKDDSDFGFVRMHADRYHVGRFLMTKKPNEFDPTGQTDGVDIIEEYKPRDGSQTERLQLVNAVRGSNRPCAPHFLDMDPKEEDVEFDLIELEQIPVGEPFALVVTIKSKSKETRTVQADLSVQSMYYTGVRANKVKKASGVFKVEPGSREELRMTIRPDDYMDKLVEYGIMKMFAVCAVSETHQVWCEEDDLQVVKPPIKIEVPQEIKVGKPVYVTFSFTNPIQRRLSNCVINVEGPFFSRFSTIKHKDLEIGEEMRYTHRFIPRRSGSQSLIAIFSSKELIDICGSSVIEVA